MARPAGDVIMIGVSVPVVALTGPRLRGRLHQIAALASVGGVAWLLSDARTDTGVIAACVYGFAMVLLYATSATYHVYTRSPRARRIMKRLDHSMIYVLIAGTYTPVCLLALHGTTRWALLSVVWAGALLGIACTTLAHDRFRSVCSALYLVLGWAAVAAVPALARRPDDLLAVALLGGLVYTLGALLFALHWPRPAARWFGYHELWHVCSIAAGAAFFVVNLRLIAGA